VLLVGAALMVAAGIVFALSHSLPVLVIAAVIGVFSPSGADGGPFLAVEHAALSGLVTQVHRTGTLAWYHLVASAAAARGALVSGGLTSLWPGSGALDAYRAVVRLMQRSASSSCW
jgi:MFS family permease